MERGKEEKRGEKRWREGDGRVNVKEANALRAKGEERSEWSKELINEEREKKEPGAGVCLMWIFASFASHLYAKRPGQLDFS